MADGLEALRNVQRRRHFVGQDWPIAEKVIIFLLR
jgi:hypothetical protein